MTEDVDKVKDLLAKLMDVRQSFVILFIGLSPLLQADIKPLKQRGVLWGSPDPVKLHPYAAQARMSTLDKEQRWAYGPLARLSSLARAMGYLVSQTFPAIIWSLFINLCE
jgi:ATP-dependent DNA helicase MPH1